MSETTLLLRSAKGRILRKQVVSIRPILSSGSQIHSGNKGFCCSHYSLPI